MSAESITKAARSSLRHRADRPETGFDLATLAIPMVFVAAAVGFVIIGGGNLELGPTEAKLGLSAVEPLGPFGQSLGGWDPGVWVGSVLPSRIWATASGMWNAAIVRWPAVIAGIVIGLFLVRSLRKAMGPRSACLMAMCWFGGVALIDRSADAGLDLFQTARPFGVELLQFFLQIGIFLLGVGQLLGHQRVAGRGWQRHVPERFIFPVLRDRFGQAVELADVLAQAVLRLFSWRLRLGQALADQLAEVFFLRRQDLAQFRLLGEAFGQGLFQIGQPGAQARHLGVLFSRSLLEAFQPVAVAAYLGHVLGHLEICGLEP